MLIEYLKNGKELIVKRINIFMVSLLFCSCSVIGIGNEEQPLYEVITKDDKKEIRKYKSYIIAKTAVKGSFKEAQKKGFKILAGFIFGKNESKESITATSKITIKKQSEKIAMTSPVTITPNIESENNDSWIMTFSMPSKYSLNTLPKPLDKRVIIEKVSAKYVASYQFTGFWNKSINDSKAEKLFSWLKKKQKYEIISKPKFAGFNPPWTLPFLRRNEIQVELELLKI
jgi:hypothetical protein